MKRYVLSLPERVIRSVLGFGAGVTRQLSEVALPAGVRRSRLYQSLVDRTLRFLIEQVGGAEGVYAAEGTLPGDFLARRTVGNVVEALGIVAFHLSPVWVLAAMSDLCGVGRQVIPEIADALKAQGLLQTTGEFSTVDEILDGLEQTSGRIAETINTPPLDVAGLRAEWRAIRADVASSARALPSRETITALWQTLKSESARQQRSVFETSSAIAIAAVRTGAVHTGQMLTQSLVEHYQHTLRDIRDIGYATYVRQQLSPYVTAAVRQFSPEQRTLTGALLDKLDRRT